MAALAVSYFTPSNNDLSERALIESAIAGNQDAFAELVRRYSARVQTTVTTVLRDAAWAEDVCQVVFLQVHRNLPSFNFQSKFSTWLHRIAVNQALMAIRTNRKHTLTIMPMPDTMDEEGNAEDRFIEGRAFASPYLMLRAREIDSAINDALNALEPAKRRMAALYFHDGLPTPEIARVTGASQPAVKAVIHRARRVMQAKLAHLL